MDKKFINPISSNSSHSSATAIMQYTASNEGGGLQNKRSDVPDGR